MDKKEFAVSFIDTLLKGDEEKIYKFFTSRSTIVFLDEQKEMQLNDFVKYLKENLFNQEIKINRVFESRVCVKVEIESPKFNYEAFLFDIQDRRIKRLEIM